MGCPPPAVGGPQKDQKLNTQLHKIEKLLEEKGHKHGDAFGRTPGRGGEDIGRTPSRSTGGGGGFDAAIAATPSRKKQRI